MNIRNIDIYLNNLLKAIVKRNVINYYVPDIPLPIYGTSSEFCITPAISKWAQLSVDTNS